MFSNSSNVVRHHCCFTTFLLRGVFPRQNQAGPLDTNILTVLWLCHFHVFFLKIAFSFFFCACPFSHRSLAGDLKHTVSFSSSISLPSYQSNYGSGAFFLCCHKQKASYKTTHPAQSQKGLFQPKSRGGSLYIFILSTSIY